MNIPDQIKIGSFTLSYKFDIYVCRREDPHNDIPNTLGHEKLQSGNAWHRFWKGEENSSKKSLQVKKKKGKFHDDLNYTYNFGFQCLIFSLFSLPISTYSQKPQKYGEAVAYLEIYRTKYMHQIRRGV